MDTSQVLNHRTERIKDKGNRGDVSDADRHTWKFNEWGNVTVVECGVGGVNSTYM